MNHGKQWFLLLLPLCWCFDTEETVVKTLGGAPDVTAVCSNATLQTIVLIVCKIKTKSRGESCSVLYQHGHDFEHGCDSRFTLTTNNQTVFLRLRDLTPQDSGVYTCECSHARGTDTMHIDITVEDEEASASFMTRLIFITTFTALIIVTGVVLGLILWKSHCRSHARSSPNGLSNEDNPDDQYTSLRQPQGDLYHILECHQHKAHDKMPHSAYSHKATANLEQELSRKAETETDHMCEIYENI
ncbi:uncharacterized protein LOC125000566 [Mugil cephalus]|uniref:uncharacterized protein LOC125000566 n=1 Tax=Mugil cephalus TaxID=48193 RepID=UPI001FB61249|nr:uncharacterized protein LOC125000566 [Mugil cephalus]XP_047432039.1 uncharacterized protein LOC125000566 [Mugil cephalus]